MTTFTIEHFVKNDYAIAKDVGQSTINQLLCSVKLLTNHLGRVAELDDFRDDTINALLHSLKEQGRKPSYIRKVRSDMLAIWREAFEACMIPNVPMRVRKIKVRDASPEAWELDECHELLKATAIFRHELLPNGISRMAWHQCYIQMGYDTALRKCDLLRIRYDDIRKDGKIRMVQQKTGDPQISQLGLHSLRAIIAIAEPRRDIILDWPFSKQTLHNDFRKLVNAAGLRGTPKWLRRSAATHVESVQPGMAQRLLGHRTAAMARKHYIDPCQLETVAVPQSIPTTGLLTYNG